MPDPTTFNLEAPLTAIQTMMDEALKQQLADPPGESLVTIGAPESFGNQVTGYVTVGADRPGDKSVSGPVLERWHDYFCAFGYGVEGAEQTAELVMARAIDRLVKRFYVDRQAGAGLFVTATTQVSSGELDLSLGNSPEYQVWAGAEQRVYPFLVGVRQRANVSLLAAELEA